MKGQCSHARKKSSVERPSKPKRRVGPGRSPGVRVSGSVSVCRGTSLIRTPTSPQGHPRVLDIVLLWSPTRGLFLTSEVPLCLGSQIWSGCETRMGIEPRLFSAAKLAVSKRSPAFLLENTGVPRS